MIIIYRAFLESHERSILEFAGYYLKEICPYERAPLIATKLITFINGAEWRYSLGTSLISKDFCAGCSEYLLWRAYFCFCSMFIFILFYIKLTFFRFDRTMYRKK